MELPQTNLDFFEKVVTFKNLTFKIAAISVEEINRREIALIEKLNKEHSTVTLIDMDMLTVMRSKNNGSGGEIDKIYDSSGNEFVPFYVPAP